MKNVQTHELLIIMTRVECISDLRNWNTLIYYIELVTLCLDYIDSLELKTIPRSILLKEYRA